MLARAPSSAEDQSEVLRLRILYHLLAALVQAKAPEDVYEAALTSLLQATDADRVAILLFDEDGVIRFKASRGLSSQYQDAVTGHSPWLQGSLDAKPIVVADVLVDESLAAYRDVLDRENIRSLAFVPLALNAGVLGKFMLYYQRPHEFTTAELDIAQAIGVHVALAAERKRAEQALARSQTRLQAILQHSAALIFLKDALGRYVLVNRQFEEMHGRDVLGRTDFDLFPPDQARQYRDNDLSVIAAGKSQTVEEDATLPDGVHYYVSLKFPLRDPDGAVIGSGGISTDITELKQLELVRERLASIVESSDDAIVSRDLSGIIISWNQGAERIFGYTAEEVIGRDIVMLTPPGQADEGPLIFSKIREGKRIDHYETRRRAKDGRIIDISLSISPVRNASGRIIGGSKIMRDITERKRAEQDRQAILAREQESRRIAELLNRLGRGMAAQLDPEKLVQEVTDIATALSGAEIGAFFYNTINESGEASIHSALSGAASDAFAGLPVPRPEDVFGSDLRMETVIRCDDLSGENAPTCGLPAALHPVRSYLAAPVIARSGEVLGGLFFGHSSPGRFATAHEELMRGIAAQAGVALDNARLFSQSKWIQGELKRSNEQLRRANRDLEVFAYSASHDLQEPLRTIAVSAQLIERSWARQAGPQEVAFLNNILSASRRMGILIEDLLTYTQATKYDEGAPQAVDATQVLSDVLQNMTAAIEEAGASVTTGTLPGVCVHASRLAQLFQNLIGNAIKYRSEVSPQIRITAEEKDGWCVFSVQDNGIGIEPQYAQQIFGLFKRLHGRDEYPGTGIGLAVCQRVVEQYGGRIWLERSALHGGSTFCFAVPGIGSEPADGFPRNTGS